MALRRGPFTKEFKPQVVHEVQAGKSLAQAAREHDLHASTQYGGALGYGAAFQYVIATGTETPVLSFDGPTDGGYDYSGPLYSASDGYFYGTLQAAGAFGGGSIYRRGSTDGKYLFQFGY